jgi:hypothetical protein
MTTSPANNIPDEWKDEPRITLARKEWAVPPMSARTIIKFLKVAGNLVVSEQTLRVGGEQLEALYEAVHCGLIRAYPEVTLDAFMDMPVAPTELMGAFKIIGEAAGLEVDKVKAGEDSAAASLAIN